MVAQAAAETEEAIDGATPDAARLARRASDGLVDLAEKTGEAAIRAGSAVASTGREVAVETRRAAADVERETASN